ncbi:hypothetical protein [Anaerocolumna xylanovorans]|uniref:Uncharacterized protein n=1 Tax=Anaerocolumna xylanovorans DSM 12503 TaxID=1121345 RepID=A0A1M7YNK7_9FIRM|nr:hypothetical protein [Anaerocolumna xylanovorans]SHO54191.1 hypothetical protein SAMN02745217_04647 [Anaerocolumna xylanovorans DSM 12503]
MTIEMNQDLGVQVYLHEGNTFMSSESVAINSTGSTGEFTGDASAGMPTDMGGTVKDPLLSSWPFVIGISFLTLAVSVAVGILLAKRKIKKGIELYED